MSTIETKLFVMSAQRQNWFQKHDFEDKKDNCCVCFEHSLHYDMPCTLFTAKGAMFHLELFYLDKQREFLLLYRMCMKNLGKI